MGIVTSITLRMDKGSIFQTGGQLVVACGDRETAKQYVKHAISFMIDFVFPNECVSQEIVITSDFTVICTLVFYDTFLQQDPSTFIQRLRDGASECNAPIVADDVTQWRSWFEAASSLWPVIAEMKGDPLIRMDHCMGIMQGVYNDTESLSTIDFLVNHWIDQAPFEKAPMSIVEIRSLGGAAALETNTIPSGNAKCQLFADMIVSYDASNSTREEQEGVSKQVEDVVADARKQSGVHVDFSATHCQSDDASGPIGEELFGSTENYLFVSSVKRKADPSNRYPIILFVNCWGE